MDVEITLCVIWVVIQTISVNLNTLVLRYEHTYPKRCRPNTPNTPISLVGDSHRGTDGSGEFSIGVLLIWCFS